MRKSCRRLLSFRVAPLLGHGRWKDVVAMSLPLEHQRHCGHFDFLWTAVDQIRSSYYLQMLLRDLTGINNVLGASLRLPLFVQMILAQPLWHQDECAPSYMTLVSNFRCRIIATSSNFPQDSLQRLHTTIWPLLHYINAAGQKIFTKGRHLRSQHLVRPWCDEVG